MDSHINLPKIEDFKSSKETNVLKGYGKLFFPGSTGKWLVWGNHQWEILVPHHSVSSTKLLLSLTFDKAAPDVHPNPQRFLRVPGGMVWGTVKKYCIRNRADPVTSLRPSEQQFSLLCTGDR